MTIYDFVKKYGTRTTSVLLRTLASEAFARGEKLERIHEIATELQSALENLAEEFEL